MSGDLLRYWRDLVYWNARKSWYVARGRRGSAPCQHPSDSGRAGETACVACIGWTKPARFRRVCPFLERRGEEWRCSVAASAVRPFWGRAIGVGLGTAAALWVVLTLGAFGVLRAVGYRELNYADFWSVHVRTRFREAQGAYYERTSSEAFARGDFPTGLLSLSIAFERNPRNWQAGLLLGQLLARTRQYPSSDRTFSALIESFPEHAGEFAEVWCDALLVRGEAGPVVALAAQEIARGSPGRGAWLRAAVNALRGVRDPAEFERLRRLLAAKLPPGWAEIAPAETHFRDANVAALRVTLNSVVPAADPVLALYRCETLLAAGVVDTAAAQCDLNEAVLGRFHASLLRYRIAVFQGNEGLANLSFENLASGELNSPKFALLCAELVRIPSRPRAETLIRAWRAAPSRASRGDLLSALQLAAWLSAAAESLKGGGSAGAFPPVVEALPSTGGRLDADSVGSLLHGLTLPREVVLVLRERSGSQVQR